VPVVHRQQHAEQPGAAEVHHHRVDVTAPARDLGEERPAQGVAGEVEPEQAHPVNDQLDHGAHHLRKQPSRQAGRVAAGHRREPQPLATTSPVEGLPGMQAPHRAELPLAQPALRLRSGEVRSPAGELSAYHPVEVVVVQVRQQHPIARMPAGNPESTSSAAGAFSPVTGSSRRNSSSTPRVGTTDAPEPTVAIAETWPLRDADIKPTSGSVGTGGGENHDGDALRVGVRGTV
jgi:hypothetical protein